MNLQQTTAFNPNYYLQKYPDVRNTGIDASWHWINYGHAEGRFGNQNYEQAYNNSNKKENPIIIFNQPNFVGKSAFLAEGLHNAFTFGMNDNVFSIKVQKGYAVVLIENFGGHSFGTGKTKVITENLSNFNDFGITSLYILKLNQQLVNIPKGSLPKCADFDTDTPNWFDENFYVSQVLELQLLYTFGLLCAGQAYFHWYTNSQGKIPPNPKNEYPALIMPYLPIGAWNVPKVRQNRLEILDIINKIKWTNKNNGQVGIDNFNVPNFYNEEQNFDFSGYEALEFTDFEYSVRKRCGTQPDCSWADSSSTCDRKRAPYFSCRTGLENIIRRIEAISEREKAWFIEKEQALAKITAEKIITNLPNTDNTKSPTLNQKPNYVVYGVVGTLLIFGGVLAYKSWKNRQQ